MPPIPRVPGLQTTLRTRPPRSVAWLLLVASAAAVLVTGLVTTALVAGRMAPHLREVPPDYWSRFLLAAALTLASLALRALRWIFLLRRRDVRIPIRDAYIGYLAGFSLLFAPLLLGEIIVRAWVHRARAKVPPAETLVVNLWERLCDLIGLGVIAGLAWLLIRPDATVAMWLAAAIVGAVVVAPAGSAGTWAVALVTSVAAWCLPGVGLWLLANAATPSMTILDAQLAYARSSLLGGLTLAPGGILVTGRQLLADLQGAGLSEADALTAVVAIRLATVGVSTALGGVMLLVHVRTMRVAAAGHFDRIAEAYDVQIPEARREALLTTKTSLMRDVLATQGLGPRGLDVGCGQGWYVGRMRALGFEVDGIDSSVEQLQAAARHLGTSEGIRLGSALAIAEADASYDFVYTINVLHHLPSVTDQRAALCEIARVLRPEGLLFVHEINTRNVLFRFYMGYVFPSLNCIDEGVERWLLPHRLGSYTDMPVTDVRYFTFLPEFLPAAVVRWLAPFERRLERSRLAPYSAHYMAVLRKPALDRRPSREHHAGAGG
jgi:ubiquinone/menaquinone biosynthesis C-methylase UbiE